MAQSTYPEYLLAHGYWLDAAEKAIDEKDETRALRLLQDLVRPNPVSRMQADGRPRYNTLGMRLPLCCNCMHYVLDENPTDPGWPMICDLLEFDMLEPWMTCPEHEMPDKTKGTS